MLSIHKKSITQILFLFKDMCFSAISLYYNFYNKITSYINKFCAMQTQLQLEACAIKGNYRLAIFKVNNNGRAHMKEGRKIIEDVEKSNDEKA